MSECATAHARIYTHDYATIQQQIQRAILRLSFGILVFFVIAPHGLEADDGETASVAGEAKSRVVVAFVGDVPIYQSDVDRHVDKVRRGRETTADALNELKAKATEQLVKRQLILVYLADKKMGATSAEIALAERRVTAELEQQGLTLSEFLAKSKSDREVFQRTLAWQIGWPRYLNRFSTDANLERFFAKRPQEFDGSRYRVAHIVWQVNTRDNDALNKVLKQAEAVRAAIEKNEISFANAAGKYSQSPTAAKGGEIGWIERRKPMPESFSKAAFQLKEGQVSSPVVSAVGVHLIKCLEIEKGEKDWQQARRAVSEAATQFLFEWVSDQQLQTTKVQYTGSSPYYGKDGRRVDPT